MYWHDATGRKLRRTGTSTLTEHIDGIQYQRSTTAASYDDLRAFANA